MRQINPETEAAGTGASRVERDYRALTEGAGFRVLDDRLIVRMRGDDRVSFLHGMCSNDIKNLPMGGIVHALFLTEHAHVIADFYAWALADELLIDIERELWASAREHLVKLLVADDVEMEESETTAVIDVEGPVATRAIAGLAAGLSVPPAWRYLDADGLRIGAVPRLGAPAFTILSDKARAAEPGEGLSRGGAVEVSAAALDTIRIENGVARVGIDTDERTIALEARLESAISFNKGCYVGQETVERATARGGIKRRLFGLRFERGRLPEIGAPVLLAGKEVGRVTSAALSPRLGPLGLSILRHGAWEVGTAVSVRNQAAELGAVVSELPFK